MPIGRNGRLRGVPRVCIGHRAPEAVTSGPLPRRVEQGIARATSRLAAALVKSIPGRPLGPFGVKGR
jgi:hypothetical protein